MKKLFVISALLLAAATGCKKDAIKETTQPQGGQQGTITTISATSPEADTRIALGGAAFNEVTWASGDVLYVAPVLPGGGLDVMNFSKFTLEPAYNGSKSGTFDLTTGPGLVAGTSYVACHTNSTAGFYPASGGYWRYTTGFQLQSAPGDFSQTQNNLMIYAPAVTVADGVVPAFTFQHAMSMIEFTITAPGAGSWVTTSNLQSVTVTGGDAYFVNIFAITETGAGPSSDAGSTSNSATLLFLGTDPLGSTPITARVLTAWNPAATISGNLTITVKDNLGRQFSSTVPATHVLVPGVIYRTAVTISSEPVGVSINGVTWARCNVGAPGTFAAAPEANGMFYQWNSKVGWSATDPMIATDGTTTWNGSWDGGGTSVTSWEVANDPCPAGWRMPTHAQQATLCDASKVNYQWTTLNGVNGYKFTDKTSGNSIFFPASGGRFNSSGALGDVGSFGYYWSATPSSATNGFYLNFYSSYVNPSFGSNRSYGLVARCVSQ